MKFILSLLLLIMTLDSFAGSASRRRRRAREAERAKLIEECKKAKSTLYSKNYECERDEVAFLEKNYLSYKTNGFNDCVNSTSEALQVRAEKDVRNTLCVQQAEIKHPDVVQKIIKENEEENKIIMSGIGAFVVFMAIILFFA